MRKKIASTLLFVVLSTGVAFADDALTPGKPITRPAHTWIERVVSMWESILNYV